MVKASLVIPKSGRFSFSGFDLSFTSYTETFPPSAHPAETKGVELDSYLFIYLFIYKIKFI